MVVKTVLIVILAVSLGASVAFAQAGNIGIFSDPEGVECDLSDTVPGLCTYYIVHLFTPGATASQFSAPLPSCMIVTYLSDGQVFPVTIGNSQTGVAIGYGSCLVAPIHILSINVFCQGLTPQCCYYDVLPDPSVASGQVEVVDCSNNLVFAPSWRSVVNSDLTCCCNCTPAEEATWGKLKSLYGE